MEALHLMSNSINIRNDKKEFSITRSVGALATLISLACFGASEANAQCATLGGTVSNWTLTGSGNWNASGDWSGGVPNSATTSACIINGTSGTPTTVTLNVSATVDDLQLGSFDTLSTNTNTQLAVAGTQIINDGAIALNGGSGYNAILQLGSNVTLSGVGTLTLSTATGGGQAIIDQAVGGLTLTNANNTIQGNGIIGLNGLSLVNQSGGSVNANVSGATLALSSMSSGVTNGGLLEATSGGILQLDGVTVNNAGGNITANSGSTVQLFGNTVIQGGTLNNLGGTLGTPNSNAATLDGSTVAGAVTLNGTYTGALGSTTYVLASIINNNNIQLNAGTGYNTVLQLGSNVTLSGGGAVTLATAGGGGQAIIDQSVGGLTLTNANNTIQGNGIIGLNGLSLVNQSGGSVNANVSGATLALSSMSSGVTNGGLLEATSGGILQLDGVTVNNAGGNITANSGSTVQLFGNTVIQGGTLNNLGGTLGTPNSNAATLDGSTVAGAVTLNGTYTGALGSTTYVLGSIINNNNIQLNAGSGYNTVLQLGSNVTLSGGGTVTLATAGGGGPAILDQSVGGLTLTNANNTIQGNGIIGLNGLSLLNQSGGTVNANVSAATLTLSSMSSGLTNGGLLEATSGGILQLDGVTVNNAGGNITANSGSTVQLFGNAVIQGGTLTNNGSFLGTPGGNVATLDGSTGAGAVTLNGTYTSDTGSNTYLLGTINNQGNFLLNGGSGANAIALLDSPNVTLQGGGTVTMAVNGGGGSAYLEQTAGGLTLTNTDNTIQGAGVIGNGGLTLVNQATINANSSGQTLLLNASGGITNTGVMEASDSGVLQIDGITVNNTGGNN